MQDGPGSWSTALLLRILATGCALMVAGGLPDTMAQSRPHPGFSASARIRSLNVHAAAQRRLATSRPQALGYSPPPSPYVPGFTVLQHVPGDQHGIPGGWYALDIDHHFRAPQAGEPLAGFTHSRMTCWEVGRWQVKQPVDDLYRQRNAPPSPLPGNVPRAFWRWEGNITRQQFDSVPHDVQEHFMFGWFTFRYQIIGGHLYRQFNASTLDAMPQNRKDNLDAMEDMILHALYLFKLPDMDFILHTGDGCPPNGWPLLSWSLCRDRPQAGFGFPTYTIWRFALGAQQNKAYHECLTGRYNTSSRRPAVFWRGSTTDPRHHVALENVYWVNRVRLHKMMMDDPVFDTKIANVLQDDECMRRYVGPLGQHVDLEEYGKSAVALDIDGNGGSFRFTHRFIHLGVPVLKQVSNLTVYCEHLIAPGYMLEVYKSDLSDVKERGYQLVNEWRANPDRLQKQAEQLQGFAAAFMHQTAVVEAAAYALMEYGKKLSWKAVRDPTYTHVPFSQACTPEGVNKFPEEFCKQIQAHQ